MRKIRLLFLSLSVAALAGCTADMDKFTERLDDLEARVAALETLCAQMNEDISSMRTVISALEDGLYITDVKNVSDGYRIEFSDGETITIRHGEDGEDGVPGTPGADGQDGYTPVIGVRMDTDGIYYWTLDGEWLLDDQGNKMRVTGENGKDGADGKDGVTPVIGVAQGEDGIYYWTINGEWLLDENGNKVQAQYLGGADSEGLIEDIVVDDMGITFILSDGSELYIPLYEAITITFDAEDLLVMEPGSERDIHYTIESRLEDIRIEVLSSSDIRARVVPTDAFTGVINIRTGSSLDEYSKVVVFATNGEKMLMRTIIFEEAELYVTDASDVSIGMQGGDIQLFYMSNLECEVSISPEAQSWLSVSQTKAVEEHTLWLSVAINEGEARTGTVVVGNPDGLHITYTINQAGTVSEEQRALEREALVAIYNALNGPNWSRNDNWLSDLPVDEWYGVETNESGSVVGLSFMSNDDNIKGNIPDEIYNLINLESLFLWSTGIEWEISSKVKNFSRLRYLQAGYGLKGNIPAELYEIKSIIDLRLYGNYWGKAPCTINLEGIDNLSQLTILHLTGIDVDSFHEDLYNLNELQSLVINAGPTASNVFSVSPSIGNLKKIEHLDLCWNGLIGEIPKEIGQCTSLKRLNMALNNLTGSIPGELADCVNLESLDLSRNNLTGSLPKEFAVMNSLVELAVWDNNLTGRLDEFVDTKYMMYSWGDILRYNAFDVSNLTLQAPEFSVTDINGEEIDSEVEYSSNDYVLLLQGVDITTEEIDELEALYSNYADKGLEIIFWHYDEEVINMYPMPWKVFNNFDGDNVFYGELHYYPLFPMGEGAIYTIIGPNRTIEWSNLLNSSSLEDFLSEAMGEVHVEDELYESSDYSADGTYELLQQATVGNGIDVVLMGDAYSDRLIADGTYRSVMENTMEQFFSEEPYKSFREYFNVYMVNVVSPNEVYGTDSRTALSTWFGDGTSVGGDDQTVFSYALNAISEDRMDEALIVVMMNRDYYAGTCWMYYPESGDYGNGVSVAYFPTSSDEATFRGLILHEAGGHGFAKLADEYAYEEYGQVPSEEITNCQNLWDFGWYPNIDFTSDPALVNWSEFIADARYQYDGLGVFEGGYTYWTGVWRPTENSIMRYNEGGFNAPSREAIYTRINKLAFGESWQYDYEDFVSYDAVNRRSEPATAPSSVLQRHEPTAPPVIVRKTWREALESSGQPEAHLKSR